MCVWCECVRASVCSESVLVLNVIDAFVLFLSFSLSPYLSLWREVKQQRLSLVEGEKERGRKGHTTALKVRKDFVESEREFVCVCA